MNPREANTPSPLKPFPWLLFAAVIFGPPLLTLLVALIGGSSAAPGFALAGAVGSGIAAGVLVGMRLGRSDTSKVVLTLMFIAVFGFSCLALNCFGCMAGGFKMDMH